MRSSRKYLPGRKPSTQYQPKRYLSSVQYQPKRRPFSQYQPKRNAASQPLSIHTKTGIGSETLTQCIDDRPRSAWIRKAAKLTANGKFTETKGFGQASFYCSGCENKWTSNRAIVTCNLRGEKVVKFWKQGCRVCHRDSTPSFTAVEWISICEQVIDSFLRKLDTGSAHNELLVLGLGPEWAKPHESSLCEACKAGKCVRRNRGAGGSPIYADCYPEIIKLDPTTGRPVRLSTILERVPKKSKSRSKSSRDVDDEDEDGRGHGCCCCIM